MTLDGVPSPPGYMSDQEEDMCFEGVKPVNQTAASNKGLRGLLHPQQLQLMSRQLGDPDGSCPHGAVPGKGVRAVLVSPLEWIVVGGLAFVCYSVVASPHPGPPRA